MVLLKEEMFSRETKIWILLFFFSKYETKQKWFNCVPERAGPSVTLSRSSESHTHNRLRTRNDSGPGIIVYTLPISKDELPSESSQVSLFFLFSENLFIPVFWFSVSCVLIVTDFRSSVSPLLGFVGNQRDPSSSLKMMLVPPHYFIYLLIKKIIQSYFF